MLSYYTVYTCTILVYLYISLLCHNHPYSHSVRIMQLHSFANVCVYVLCWKSNTRPSLRGRDAGLHFYICHLHGFACPCLCMCLYDTHDIWSNCNYFCLLCAPAVYGQCTESKWKVRSLLQASSVVDLLEGVCMVCDCGFVFRHGPTLLIITYGGHCHIHHCKGW